MGGGGSYYNRDVTDSGRRNSRGVSDIAESAMSRSYVNPALLPEKRRISSSCRSPVVYAFDVTGSMGDLPKIIFDKMPMIAGQLVENGYLKEPEISLAAVGDVVSDRAPIQIGDFSPVKTLDDWLKRIYLEGNGGGQNRESYEFIAYYYLKYYDMKNAKTPIFLITGDEGFRETLPQNELKQHFGGEQENAKARDVFEQLKKKFKGNVFLIHRKYGDGDAEIVRQWEGALGKDNVIHLANDLAIADVTLGLFALVSGKRTLGQYISDIKNRPLEIGGVTYKPQSQERIDQVRRSLEPFAAAFKVAPDADEDKPAKDTAKRPASKPDRKKPDSGKPKRGRI